MENTEIKHERTMQKLIEDSQFLNNVIEELRAELNILYEEISETDTNTIKDAGIVDLHDICTKYLQIRDRLTELKAERDSNYAAIANLVQRGE